MSSPTTYRPPPTNYTTAVYLHPHVVALLYGSVCYMHEKVANSTPTFFASEYVKIWLVRIRHQSGFSGRFTLVVEIPRIFQEIDCTSHVFNPQTFCCCEKPFSHSFFLTLHLPTYRPNIIRSLLIEQQQRCILTNSKKKSFQLSGHSCALCLCCSGTQSFS